MNRKLLQLAKHREYLLRKIEDQRIALAQDMVPLHTPFALADKGMAALHYLKHHPAISAGTTLAFAAWLPERAGKYLRRGWLIWQVGRKLFGKQTQSSM